MTEQTLVRYEPWGAALKLFSTRSGEVLMDGPAGTGKSLACLFRLHLACLQHKGIRCLIVRKVANSLGSTTLVTFEQKVAAEAIASRVVTWYGGSPREAACYRYKNGSRIVVGGMDKPEKIMSSDYDLVFADEATELTIDDWEAIQTRLRYGKLPWQQAIAACNPANPVHWLNQRAGEGGMTRLYSRHQDNPRYYTAGGELTEAGRDYIGNKLGALTGVRRTRLLDGTWAAAEGLIYDEFDPAVHVVTSFGGYESPPATWPRYWSVDFGYTNPFVWQCWVVDPDGRMYLHHEIYYTQKLVSEFAKCIMDLTVNEPKPVAIICDHDAEGRATLSKALGRSTVAAHKKVTEGIQAVQNRLRVAKDGWPRIFVHADALVQVDPALREAAKPVRTLDEMASYVWASRPGGNPKEEPVKENDHGMDAMRYAVAHLDLGRSPRYRSFSVQGV